MSQAAFRSELARRSTPFERIDERKHQYLAMHGRLAEAIAEIESVVPEARRTPMEDLILGNMLYAVDPRLALEHHRRAWMAYPDQPDAMLPMAMQLQRDGKLDSALELYRGVERIGTLDKPRYALMAQCLIHAGRLDEALDAWSRADYATSHNEIDQTIQSVFGPTSPMARHDSLLAAVRGGSMEAVGPLLDLGVAWNTDWWNAAPNPEALAVDVEAITARFGPQSTIARDASLLAEAVDALGKGKEALARFFRINRIAIEGGTLPETSTVARHLVELALAQGLVDEASLDRRFHAELLARIRHPEGDRAALEIMARLASKLERTRELAEIDLAGWMRHGDPEHAFSFLAHRLWTGDKIFTEASDTLARAITQFPRDSRFPGIAYKLAADAGRQTPETIARVIEAEYYGLMSDRSRSGAALNALFGNLRQELSRRKSEKKK